MGQWPVANKVPVTWVLKEDDLEKSKNGFQREATPPLMTAVPHCFTLDPTQTITACLQAARDHNLPRATLEDMAKLGLDMTNATKI